MEANAAMTTEDSAQQPSSTCTPSAVQSAAHIVNLHSLHGMIIPFATECINVAHVAFWQGHSPAGVAGAA